MSDEAQVAEATEVEAAPEENVVEETPEELSPLDDMKASIESMEDDVAKLEAGEESEGEEESEAEASEDEGTKPEAESSGDAEEDAEAEPPPQPERYTALKGEEPVQVEWPEGTKVTFRADGKDVTVESMEQIVNLASQGVAVGRIGVEKQELQAQLDTVTASAKEQVELAEALLIAAFTDEEKSAQIRAVVEKYADPEYAEGVKAKAALADREATDVKDSEALEAEQSRQFWTGVTEHFEGKLGDEAFPHLRPEDAGEVRGRLHALYETELEERYTALVNGGISEERALAVADEQALQWLGTNATDSIRTIMSELQAGYAARLGQPAKPDTSSAATPEEDPETKANEHNARVEGKLAQRESNRGIRGGGAAPAAKGGDQIDTGPKSMDDHKAGIAAELNALLDS